MAQKGVERKIQMAMKKRSTDESLQSYTNTKIKNIYKLLDNIEDVKPDKTQVVDYLEREHEYQTKISQMGGVL